MQAAPGAWNRRIGWALLIAGFAWAAALDPWSLSEHDPARLVGSSRMAARQAQAVVLGMAILQLLVAGLLDAITFTPSTGRAVGALVGIGAVVYTLGYVLGCYWTEALLLAPAGALLNFGGFAIVWAALKGVPVGRGPRVVLPILCLGMLLDATMGLFRAEPGSLLPIYLGADDGVRLRMLRLARAAVIALSAVALLYQTLAARAKEATPLVERGQVALWVGVLLMPTVLAAAAFTDVRIKYLLCIPAAATFSGTCIGVWLAWRYATPLERWGWALIAASMGTGLLMGLYAFDGPLPEPAFLGDYDDWPRRLSRLGHAYTVLLGLLAICVARETNLGRIARTYGVPLLLIGSVITLGMIFFTAVLHLPPGVLGVGPALVATATLMCRVTASPAGVPDK